MARLTELVPAKLAEAGPVEIKAVSAGWEGQTLRAMVLIGAELESVALNSSYSRHLDAERLAGLVEGKATVAQIEQALLDLLEPVINGLAAKPKPQASGIPAYSSGPEGIIWDRPGPGGDSSPFPLTNFDSRIRAEVSEDDGAEIRAKYEMESTFRGRIRRFLVPSAQFESLRWLDNIGASATVYAGFGRREHVPNAIRALSDTDGIVQRTVYRHTGWRLVADEPVYLHAGGAIGKDGAADGIEAEQDAKLSLYFLPEPPAAAELATALRMSLSIADVLRGILPIALIGAVYRAPLGGADMSVFLSGRTGTRKSTAAALAQQHFGAEMHRLALPQNWYSTTTDLEASCFLAKDALLTIDEFKPGSVSGREADKLQAKAGQILQSLGNNSARGRSRADLTGRPDRRPRAFVLCTGEDVPDGESTRARLAIVEVKPGDVPLGPALDALQAAGESGVFAGAMAGYIRWLALHYQDRVRGWRRDFEQLRKRFEGSHARTPEVMAHLALGWRYLLDFALEVGGVSTPHAEAVFGRVMAELGKLASAQSRLHAEADPVHRFLGLLGEAIASGRAHVVARDGNRPGYGEPESSGADLGRAWGWRNENGDWKALGRQIGWLDGQDLFLLPAAAHAAAAEMASAGGQALPIGPNTLGKRLAEAGKLASVMSNDEPRVPRKFTGVSRRVLHIPAHGLYQGEISATSATSGAKAPEHANSAVANLETISATGADTSATRLPNLGNGCQSSEGFGNRPNHLLADVSGGGLPKLPNSHTGIAHEQGFADLAGVEPIPL